MVTFWGVLGIEPTVDPRRIKKAYASRLKRVHPEDDPEGFQIIRSAYEAALSWAKDYVDERPNEDLPPEPTPRVTALMEALEASLELALAPQEREPQKEAPRPRPAGSTPRVISVPTAEQRREEQDRVSRALDALMRKVRALEKRNEWSSEAAWAPLIEGEVLWDLDLKSAFQSVLFDFLGTGRRELAYGVWRLLDQRFRWEENAREFYRSRDASTVDWVLEQLHDARRFRPVPPTRKAPVRPRPSPRLRLDEEREVLTLLPGSTDLTTERFLLLLLLAPFLTLIGDLLIAFFL